jgi:ubiquinone/menaquinone biosynthesis C-methylase UbiE
MSSPEIKRLREETRSQWSDQRTTAARSKWYPKLAVFLRGATEAVVEAANLRAGLEVVDLASGMGEPALSVAAAIAPGGCVTATDIDAGILAAVEENAARRGLSNIVLRLADAEALPFPDQSFDRVTCRFGVMFFADHLKALREARRVLKPGGCAVYVVWGPADQPVYAATVGVLEKYVQPPPRDPDAPHPFKFSAPGKLRRALAQAGFEQACEELRPITMVWDGPPEEFWQQFAESAAPFRPLIDGLPAERRDDAVREIVASLGRYADAGQMKIPGIITLGTGIRG